MKNKKDRCMFEFQAAYLCSIYIEIQRLYFMLLWMDGRKHKDSAAALIVRRLLINGIIQRLQGMYSSNKGSISVPNCLKYGSQYDHTIQHIKPIVFYVPSVDYSLVEISSLMDSTYSVLTALSEKSRFFRVEHLRTSEDLEELYDDLKDAVRETFRVKT